MIFWSEPDARFEFFLPYGPMLTKMKKIVRSQILQSQKKKKKRSGDMVDRYLSPKFGVSIHLTISEKTMSTDGRQAMDVHVMTVALLCSSTNQS